LLALRRKCSDQAAWNAVIVEKNLQDVARELAKKRDCTVVITGKRDIVADEWSLVQVLNGHP